MIPEITLILGGARSGKSRRAEQLAAEKGLPVTFLSSCATHLADAEMLERIRIHRKDRPNHWTTIENEFDIAAVFQAHSGRTVLFDCLTMWLSFHFETLSEAELLPLLGDSLATARTHGVNLLIVSNEMGMGLVPSNPLGRSFRDLCGRANQLVAEVADRVEFQIAGIPLALKGGLSR